MKNKLPVDWDGDKIERIIEFYETQSEEEAVAEDERALATEETPMQVPFDLVADVRALIAREQMKH